MRDCLVVVVSVSPLVSSVKPTEAQMSCNAQVSVETERGLIALVWRCDYTDWWCAERHHEGARRSWADG